MQKLLLGFTLALLCNISYGCYTPLADIHKLNGQPIVRILSENAKYLLEMHPAKWSEKNKERWSPENEKFTVIKDSLGIVYRVAEKGLMTPIWETDGIYPLSFRSGKFPRHAEKFTFYLSNDGSKVISVLDRKWKTKSLLLVYDQSGSKSEIPYNFIPGLKQIYSCGTRTLLSHRFRKDDVLELQTIISGELKLSETWEMSAHTGKLHKKP